MPRVSTNEREFQGYVLRWFKEALGEPFTDVTQETGVDGQFPDAILWRDRKAGLAWATCELKTTTTPARDNELLDNGSQKARNLDAQLLVTWNMKDTIVWDIAGMAPEELWSYEPIPVTNEKQWHQHERQLRDRANELLIDLGQFLRDGTPPTKGHPESTVFIDGIHRTVEIMVPLYQGLMVSHFSDTMRWCAAQTIPTDDQFLTAARHAVYRLIGKLLFYQTLARVRSDLPPIDVSVLRTPTQLQTALRRHFELARAIDYQAIFEEQFPESLPFTADVAKRIRRFCQAFLPLNLPSMKLDIVGRIFESLVPEHDKKILGQYFTEPWLADLIVCSAIQTKNDLVFDPTCGTGAILLRAYGFLRRLGTTDHSRLLDALWGNDIGHFPTELALINIFRQDPRDVDNFPRILTRDIFDLRPDATIDLAPSRESGGIKKVTVKMPQFDAVIGNPPYLRRQDIGTGYDDPEAYRNKLWEQFPKYDHYSDLYVFVFDKASQFIKPGGRLCFVTANSWLDAEYGAELKRFFLQYFKLIAVFESRCEPWFENAEVNTVVTVLEKVANDSLKSTNLLSEELSQHKVAFVKFKKPLTEIINLPLDDPSRYDMYARLVADVEVATDDYETDNVRVRKVNQGSLYRNLPITASISKWGVFLRAPKAFLRVLDVPKPRVQKLNDVIETRFGTLSGKNEFYCPGQNNDGYTLFPTFRTSELDFL